MKQLATLAALAMLVIAVTAVDSRAGSPLPGNYTTLAGTILSGRGSESNPCDGCDGQIGNLLMAESWSGSALGTEWKVSCPQIAAAPVLLLDTVVGGTGQRIYRTSYSGGTMWLSGTGAWAGGDADYLGTLTAFTTIATVQIVGGAIVGVVSNINLSGDFSGYSDCFSMAITNAAMVGRTPGAAPGVWPALMGPTDCAASATHGVWWNVSDVTLSLLGSCATDANSSTWGSLKLLYR